jgi:hypothetical protein
VVDFWITHITKQLGRSEEEVRELYRRTSSRSFGKEDEEIYVGSDEDGASTVDDQEKVQALPPDSKPKNSPSASTNHREVRATDNNLELAFLKQEIECKADFC